MNALPLWVLGAVLLLTAVRRVGALHLALWQIMLGGAATVVVGGAISPTAAWRAIDWNVLTFLFGVFLLGQALVASGWLYSLSARLLGRVGRAETLLLAVILASGLASALLMNDTLAVIGTPLVLHLATAHRLPPTLLLLALAFGVTIGSAMSPIGNPQNLLIALQGELANPFLDFLTTLGPPTLLNLLLAWGVLRFAYRRQIHGEALAHPDHGVRDPVLARLARIGLTLLLLLVAARILATLLLPALALPLPLIALAAAAPPLLFSPRRIELLRHLEWSTLLFFIALFVLMRAVWETGALQALLPPGLLTPTTLLVAGTLGSQLVSNVPLVALVLPLAHGHDALLALAAGATVAGNLTLVGAASNVIIAQGAERRGAALGFWRFMAVGTPLTALNLAVYWGWLGLIGA